MARTADIDLLCRLFEWGGNKLERLGRFLFGWADDAIINGFSKWADREPGLIYKGFELPARGVNYLGELIKSIPEYKSLQERFNVQERIRSGNKLDIVKDIADSI